MRNLEDVPVIKKYHTFNQVDRDIDHDYYIDLINRFHVAFPEFVVLSFGPGIRVYVAELYNSGGDIIKKRIADSYFDLSTDEAEYLIERVNK